MLTEPQMMGLKALVEEHGVATVSAAVRYIDAHAREKRRAAYAAHLGFGEEVGPRAGPDRLDAPLKPGDPGYSWPQIPGYVGNDDGDICLVQPIGVRTHLDKGTIWVAKDGAEMAERYGWTRLREHPDAPMVQMSR